MAWKKTPPTSSVKSSAGADVPAASGESGVGPGVGKALVMRASRVRLLPVVIFAAVLMLSIRLGGLWQDASGILSGLQVGQSSANAQGERAMGAQPAPSVTRLQAPLGQDMTEDGADGEVVDNQQLAQGGGEEGAKPEGKDARKDAKKGEPSPVSYGPSGSQGDPLKDPVNFTQSEIELLQKLAERREVIESRAQELVQREALLKAAEGRIDRKIAEMQQLQTTIDGLLKKHDQQEAEKVNQLVKIYATMKPKDAARIFDELDMPILMTVLENMKESSSAPILAAMLPEKARAVTQEMSVRRRIPVPNQ